MKRYIISFKDTFKKEIIDKYNGVLVDEIKGIHNLAIVDFPSDIINDVMNDDEIEDVEEDGETEVNALSPLPIEYGQSESYFVRKLKLKDYWSRGIDGTGVKVAVLDTGIFNHRDLNIFGGLNGYDESVPYTEASNFHGTHVAGIIASQHNDLGGFIGVAPNVELYSMKCDSNSGGTGLSNSAIIKSCSWCIENGIHIMNCSFSGTSNLVNQSIISAISNGIIVVSATGNSGNLGIGSPSSLEDCVAVGNADANGERYPTSNYGEGINLVGYGYRIMSTTNTFDGYVTSTGTSMSAPVVAGVFALYKQLFPNLTSNELKQKVYENAINTNGDEYNIYTGYGIPMPPKELYELPIIKTFPKRIKVANGYGCNLVAPLNGIKIYQDGAYKDVNIYAYKKGEFV